MAQSSAWRTLALLVALTVGRVALGQGTIPPGAQPPVAPSGSTVEGQEAEGRITAIDRGTRTIRLDSRDVYVVPETMRLDWSALREGATVRMQYDVNEGRNVVTGLRILFR